MEIVELLLAAGADPAVKNRAGRTAADWARTRGMIAVARRLGFEGAAGAPEPAPPAGAGSAEVCRALAQDLVFGIRDRAAPIRWPG